MMTKKWTLLHEASLAMRFALEFLLFKKSPKCQNIYLLVYFNSPDRKSISIQVH